MNLTSSPANGATIITVNEARIDASVAIQFKDAMRAHAGCGDGDVVLDLGQVTFVDSSGLGAIVGSMKYLDTSRRLHLAALTPDVDKVFRLTRMDSIFEIHDDTRAFLARAAG